MKEKLFNFKNQGEELSNVCLSLLLITNAELSDGEAQNVQAKLNIEEAAQNETSEAYRNIFDKTKAALRSHQYAKDLNSVSSKSNTAKRNLLTLVTEYEQENCLESQEIEEVESFFTNKKKKGGKEEKPK